MNADGTGMLQLTNNSAYDGSPRWSPDGKLIAFSSDRAEPDHFDVYVMRSDGTDARQVTFTPAGATAINPVWFPLP
jgi:Tol biopolymer transport system component